MGHNEPGAVILLKPNKNVPDYDSIFRLPDSFNKVFAFEYHTIWTLNCPAHYRALGVAVTEGHSPPDGEVHCIKAIFTDIADWREEFTYTTSDTDPIKIYKQRYSDACQRLGTAAAHATAFGDQQRSPKLCFYRTLR